MGDVGNILTYKVISNSRFCKVSERQFYAFGYECPGDIAFNDFLWLATALLGNCDT